MRIGIDLGGTKIELIALDNQGQECIRLRVPTPRGGYQATLDAIKNANSTWLLDQPLVEDLSDRLGRPVRQANDADCFALSEAVDGAAVGAGSVFGVIIGTGTGAGILIRGQLLSGPNAIAGEWGHNPLPWPQDDELPGTDCYCGLHGCLETWLSGPGFAASFYRLSGKNLDAPTVVELARQGGSQAQACLEAYFDRLARSLASAATIIVHSP